MADVKQVWTFQDPEGGIWSETWYRAGAAVSLVPAVDQGFKAARLGLLHSLCFLTTVRQTVLGGQRETAEGVFDEAGTSVITGGPSDVNAAVVVKLNALSFKHRFWWLRGCPGGAFSRSTLNGIETPPGSLTAALEAVKSVLASSGYGLRTLKRVSDRTPPTKVGVFDVTRTANGDASVRLNASNNPFQNTARVILQRFSPKDFPGMNGHYDNVGTTNSTIIVRYVPVQAGPISAQGAFVVSEEYTGISPYTREGSGFDHYGSHTTRDLFSRSRGARRAKRLRLLP